MGRETVPETASCDRIRPLLPQLFAAEPPKDAREIEAHLLECGPCSEQFAELSLQQLEADPAELREPPVVPDMTLYRDYLSGRSGRLGLPWQAIGQALTAADEQLREWGRTARSETLDVLRALLVPVPVPAAAGLRVRGELQETTSPEAPKPELEAELLHGAWEPTGQRVRFTLEDGPRVTPEGELRLRLTAATARYRMHAVACVVALGPERRVWFAAPLTRIPGRQASEATLQVEAPGLTSGELPPERITLYVIDRSLA